MTQRAVTHASFVIEREYKAGVAKVFAALADPEKKRRWFRESEKTELVEFTMDFRVGGRESSRFRMDAEFAKGEVMECTNETVYLDIVPESRVVFAYTMAMDGRRFSASMATFELLGAGAKTKLIFTEQAAFFEGSDGPTMREEGWDGLLARLGAAVEETQ